MAKKENRYFLDKKEKSYFISCLLLEAILNHKKTFNILNLDNDNSYLEEYFIDMISNGYIKMSEDNKEFNVTDLGRKLYKNFNTKLIEFRSLYKIYSAVDTGEGEFGYGNFYEFETDEEFEEYISNERFEDLRVALCEFKGINPLEIVFLDLVEENRFDLNTSGWQFELTSDLVWDELIEIVNSNIKVSDLSEEETDDSDGYTGEEVMEIIIERATEVYKTLLEIEEEEDTIEINTWEVKFY